MKETVSFESIDGVILYLKSLKLSEKRFEIELKKAKENYLATGEWEIYIPL